MHRKFVGLRIANTWQALVDHMTILSKEDGPSALNAVLSIHPDKQTLFDGFLEKLRETK